MVFTALRSLPKVFIMKSSHKKVHVRKFRGRPLVLSTPVSLPSDTFGSTTADHSDYQWVSWKPFDYPCYFDPEALPRFSEHYLRRHANIISAVDNFNSVKTINMSSGFKSGLGVANHVMGKSFKTLPSRSSVTHQKIEVGLLPTSNRSRKNALQKRNFMFDLSGKHSSSQVVSQTSWVKPRKLFSSLRIDVEDFYVPHHDDDEGRFPITVLPCKLPFIQSKMNKSTSQLHDTEVNVVSDIASSQTTSTDSSESRVCRFIKCSSLSGKKNVKTLSINDYTETAEYVPVESVEDLPLLEVGTQHVASEMVQEESFSSPVVTETKTSFPMPVILEETDKPKLVFCKRFGPEYYSIEGYPLAENNARRPFRFRAAAKTVETPNNVVIVEGEDISSVDSSAVMTEVKKPEKVVKPKAPLPKKQRSEILAAQKASKSHDPLVLEKRAKGVVLGNSFDSKKVGETSFSQLAAQNAISNGQTTVTVVEPSISEVKALPAFTPELENSVPWSVRSKLMKETKYPEKPQDKTDKSAMTKYFQRVNVLKAAYQRLVCEWVSQHPVKKSKPKKEKPVVIPERAPWVGFMSKPVSHGWYSWNKLAPVRSFYPDSVFDGQKEWFYSGYQWSEYVPSFQWQLSDNSPYKGKPSVESVSEIFRKSRVAGSSESN